MLMLSRRIIGTVLSAMKSVIQQALSKYMAGPEQPVFELDLRTVAAQLHVLPLMLDMGGCYALRQDGTVISFAWDATLDHRIETDARIIRIALFQGSLKHPEIVELVPKRPVGAENCRLCHGTGKVSEKPALDAFVCYCGGLGWLLLGE
jgi:hypothetical protein